MRNLLALLLFLPYAVMAQVPTCVPADGLVAWWALDGDGTDQSAQENDGTVFGATPTTDRWGSENAAMHFASIGDRIEFGEISNDIGLPNVGMTISTWFQGEAFPTSGPSTGQVCSAYYGPGSTMIRLEVVHGISNGPGHHLKYYWRCPNENDEPVSTDEFSTSDWNHYAMVVDPTDGEVRIYLNGNVVPELTSAYSASNDYFGGQSRNWMIGSYHPQINSVPHQFSGSIDDIGIWNRALSEQEIAQLYEAGSLTFGCTDPIACNYDAAAEGDDGSCVYPPSVHLGDDIYTCAPSVVLTSTEGSSYLWNTGDTSQTIQVFDSGVYTVEVAEEVDIETEESISFLEGVEDRVIIPHIAEYDIMTSGYSIALDIKLNSFETANSGISDYIVVKLDESFGVGNNAMGFDIAISGGLPIVHFRLFDRLQSNLNYLVAIPQDSMALGEWHHMAFTIDESATRAYLNGEEVDAIETPSCFNIGNGSAPIVLGQPLEGASGFFSEFNGNIDNLQLFSRALDPMEVLSVASCPVSQLNSVDLLGYWNMEDGQDGAISDLSEFGNAAQVMNASLTSDTPSRSCSSYCAASDSVQVTILPCDNLTYLCGAGTVWDSASAQCISIADTIFIEPIACTPSCGEGTVWDPVNEECIIAIPADLNYDGCVSVNDLLVLLAVHGTCPPYPEWPDEPTDTTWACGDPLTYWDYDYTTVLIGDQCWFAENLRTEQYSNGDSILSDVTDSEWSSLTIGATAVYGEGNSHCESTSPDFDACDETQALLTYGRLYNWFAVDDVRGLCLSGWHVPSDEEWSLLESHLGLNASEIAETGYRGTNQGQQLKATSGWHNGGFGTNEFGFNALPSGYRRYDTGTFRPGGSHGYWYTSSNTGPAWYRYLSFDSNQIGRNALSPNNGFSIRCIKD